MKFSTRKDVEMTAHALFEALGDFDRLERILRRNRAEVTALDPSVEGAKAWDIGFDWRGRRRTARFALTRHDPDEALRLNGSSESFDIVLDLTIVALTRARSRVVCEANLRPRTMKARLLVQTAKLSKGALDSRFAQGTDRLVEQMIEGRVGA